MGNSPSTSRSRSSSDASSTDLPTDLIDRAIREMPPGPPGQQIRVTVRQQEDSALPENFSVEDSEDSSNEEDPEIDAPAHWQPPDPQHEMDSEEGVARLRTFQQLPAALQVQVIWLILEGTHGPNEAIDTIFTQQRLNLLERPIQAREQHAAAIRVAMDRVNDTLFQQWNIVNVLIQALPERQQETGQWVLRMMSDDPRDAKGVADAIHTAAQGLDNPFINRLLNDIADSADSFRRNENELRNLRQFDRHQPSPEPDPVEPPDIRERLEGTLQYETQTLKDVYTFRKRLRRYTEGMKAHLTGVILLSQWNAEDLVSKKVIELSKSWGSEMTTSERMQAILDCEFDTSEWDNPNCDGSSILLGALRLICLGILDHPDPTLLNRLAVWENSDMLEPYRDAERAGVLLRNMRDKFEPYFRMTSDSLRRNLDSMGPDFAVTEGLPQFCSAKDPASLCTVLRNVDMSGWPVVVRNRLFSHWMLYFMGMRLFKLQDALLSLQMGLSFFCSHFVLDGIDDWTWPLLARSSRRMPLAKRLARFDVYHDHAMEDFRSMVQLSRNKRARDVILAAFSESDHGIDLERARDIAVVAQMEQTIKESATMLWQQRMERQAFCTLLQNLEIRQVFGLIEMEPEELYGILRAFDDRNLDGYYRELVARHPDTPVKLFWGRPDFGRAVRHIFASTEGRGDRAHAIGCFGLSALKKPICLILGLVDRRHADQSFWELFAHEDVLRACRLLVRALYFYPVHCAPTARGHAQYLTRHCWQLGLFWSWERWHKYLHDMLKPLLDDVEQLVGEGALPPSILDADRTRWEDVAQMLDCSRHGQLLGAWEALRIHFRKRESLREATDGYLRLPDLIDPAALPEEFPYIDSAREEEDQDVFKDLHRYIEFDGCVLDGGRMSPRC